MGPNRACYVPSTYWIRRWSPLKNAHCLMGLNRSQQRTFFWMYMQCWDLVGPNRACYVPSTYWIRRWSPLKYAHCLMGPNRSQQRTFFWMYIQCWDIVSPIRQCAFLRWGPSLNLVSVWNKTGPVGTWTCTCFNGTQNVPRSDVQSKISSLLGPVRSH